MRSSGRLFKTSRLRDTYMDDVSPLLVRQKNYSLSGDSSLNLIFLSGGVRSSVRENLLRFDIFAVLDKRVIGSTGGGEANDEGL